MTTDSQQACQLIYDHDVTVSEAVNVCNHGNYSRRTMDRALKELKAATIALFVALVGREPNEEELKRCMP